MLLWQHNEGDGAPLGTLVVSFEQKQKTKALQNGTYEHHKH
jgi:hypothetical protein